MSSAVESDPLAEPEQPGAPNASGPAEQPGAGPAATPVDAFPRWLRQLALYLPICSQFVVEGNIRDVHIVRSPDGLLFQPTVHCLWELLRGRGCESLLVYDRVSGMRVFPDDRRQVVEESGSGGRDAVNRRRSRRSSSGSSRSRRRARSVARS